MIIENKKVSKTEMVDVLKNNVGKFITIVFTKKNNCERVCNGQFVNNFSTLGYYTFKEKGQDYKQFDPKLLKEVRVNKTIYQTK